MGGSPPPMITPDGHLAVVQKALDNRCQIRGWFQNSFTLCQQQSLLDVLPLTPSDGFARLEPFDHAAFEACLEARLPSQLLPSEHAVAEARNRHFSKLPLYRSVGHYRRRRAPDVPFPYPRDAVRSPRQVAT